MNKEEEEDTIHRFSIFARQQYDILPGTKDHHQYLTWNTSDGRIILIRKITEPLFSHPPKADFYTCTDWLMYKPEIVQSRLKHFFGKSKKLHGRDCEVRRIDAHLAGEFLSKNHLHGPLTGKYKYGLFHKKMGQVGVATFAQARNFTRENRRIVSSEILALSFLLGHSVSGGFQKLLQAHIRDRKPNEIMTYSDLDLGRINIYSRSGFVSKGYSSPKSFKLDTLGNRKFGPEKNFYPSESSQFSYCNQGFEKWVLSVNS